MVAAASVATSPDSSYGQSDGYATQVVVNTYDVPQNMGNAPVSGYQRDPQQECAAEWASRQSQMAAECKQLESGQGAGPYGSSDPAAFCAKDAFVAACKAGRVQNGMGEISDVDFQSICEAEAKTTINQMTRFCEDSKNGNEQCKKSVEQKCDFAKRQLEKCKAMSDPAKLKSTVSDAVARYCKRKIYVGSVAPSVASASAPTASQVVPMLVSVPESISAQDEAKLRSVVDSVDGYVSIKGSRVYSVRASSAAVEKLKALGIIDDAQFDSVKYTMQQVQAPGAYGAGNAVSAGVAGNSTGLRQVLTSLEASKAVASSDVRPWLASEQDKLTDVTAEVDAVQKSDDSKDLAYKVSWFFGMQAQKEKDEAAKLAAQSAKLNETIVSLSSLADQVDDLALQSALKEQINALEKQQADLDSLSKQKADGAAGMLSFFGAKG